MAWNTGNVPCGIYRYERLSKISKPVGEQTRSFPTFADFRKPPSINISTDSHVHEDGKVNGETDESNGTRPPLTFAKVVQAQKEEVKINFRRMESSDTVEGVDVVIPVSSVKEVHDRFENTLYGYFLGKRLAYPVVDYYVKNNWAKYGLMRMMMNTKGFFFFKFKTKKGLEQLMEDGPWTIRNVPIILKEWSPSATLMKEEITDIPVWVKMHDVPLPAFTEDGLSLLASKIGVPKMVDLYTASMCSESWGRSSFARTLIEVNAGKELKRSVLVAVPSMDGKGYSKAEVRIEYDWEPLRCPECCVFGHDSSTCPKNPKHTTTDDGNKRNDEFQDVKGKNKKGGQSGFHVQKQKQRMVYRPVVNNKSDRDAASSSRVGTSNSFAVLQDDAVLNNHNMRKIDNVTNSGGNTGQLNHTVDNVKRSNNQPVKASKSSRGGTEEVIADDVAVDDLLAEIPSFMDQKLEGNNFKGASTPNDGAWNWMSNASCCNRGTRIMIGWDANLVDVMVLHQTDQVVHLQITFKLDRKSFFCSFVYAENHYNTRRELWNDLCKHNLFVGHKPWVMLGDFNSILFLGDSLSGSSTSNIGTREFRECVNNIEMVDVNSSGLHYTWTNKQKKGKAIFRKIDRVMGNSKFIDVFPDAAACFLPYRISDHTPYTLVLPNIKKDKAKPFKFVNLLAEKKEFLDEVKRVWDTEVNGHAMFQVVKKLKCLKSPMRKLMYKQGNLHEKVKILGRC
ncbi:uncharacterized protein LOC110944873 [Helianthus annuus]|uniref:uncharacterized protein LOC110944873 n=1 Tax=Helianthus annuus TaxID=4232 RepID=UPI000B8FD009|nr:uncharacterized protein LOC110944873 [Helianthus annuus]